MTKLADITSEIRVVIKILGISFAIVAILFMILRGGQIVKNVFFPTPPPPPEEKFGQLPPVVFPGQNPANLTYRINTITGKLPQFPDRMKVYMVKTTPPSLVALDKIRNNLKTVGYFQNEAKIDQSTYRWNNSGGNVILYNIVTNNFKISSNIFATAPDSQLSNSLPDRDGAYQAAIGFLQGINEDTSDLDQNKSTITYLKINNSMLVAATSQNDAQFVRIDLFQKDIDKYRIYYPGLSESLMYFIYKEGNYNPEIVDAGFSHYAADPQNSSDYPIKTADEAFKDLESGNAYVISSKSGAGTIDITEISLGYYIGQDQQYLLPIVIFTGSGFTGYVNALAAGNSIKQ